MDYSFNSSMEDGNVKYTILMYWLSFKWIFRINLGDMVKFGRSNYVVANGVRVGSWRLHGLDNGDNGWVKRSECQKIITPQNLYCSFKSGVRFYRSSWLGIWKHEGIKPWMKGCNIW